jgi:Fic family protein
MAKLKSNIDRFKPHDENLNQLLQERLRIEWIYNSNAIEGNTLTLGETSFFLRESLTSDGKPLKDFLETKNHAEAIAALETIISGNEPLSEFFIKSLHGVLLKGIDFTHAKHALGKLVKKPLHVGAYKTQPNHVLTVSGKIYHYVDPLHVKDEMEGLLKWCNDPETQKLSAIEKAALFHYRFVKIHPFDDGNGRLSRLLMNVILMQAGFPPCVIKNKNRKRYLTALEQADETGDHDHFLRSLPGNCLRLCSLFIIFSPEKKRWRSIRLKRLPRKSGTRSYSARLAKRRCLLVKF